MAAPLTLADVLLGPELLPSEPAAEFEAPGNGVTRASPLVVKTIRPRFVTAGEIRSSSKQSHKFGFNSHCRRIGAFPQGIHCSLRSLSLMELGLTGQSVFRLYIIIASAVGCKSSPA
jgi:hypothetical protein